MPAARVSALDDFGAIRCSAVASLLTTARTLPLTMLTIPFFLQPREALLKYAKLGEEDPQWTAGESLTIVLWVSFSLCLHRSKETHICYDVPNLGVITLTCPAGSGYCFFYAASRTELRTTPMPTYDAICNLVLWFLHDRASQTQA